MQTFCAQKLATFIWARRLDTLAGKGARPHHSSICARDRISRISCSALKLHALLVGCEKNLLPFVFILF